MKRIMKKIFLIILILASEKLYSAASLSNNEISDLLNSAQPEETSSILNPEENPSVQPNDDSLENNRRSFFENQETATNKTSYNSDLAQMEAETDASTKSVIPPSEKEPSEKKDDTNTQQDSTATQPNALLTSLLGGGGIGSGVSLLVAIGYLGFKSSSKGQMVSDHVNNFSSQANSINDELSRPIQEEQISRPINNQRRRPTILH
jgi:hypothetical protein